MNVHEIVPGVIRIESELGVRFMTQYLLVGEDRAVLVDTGLARTPDEVLAPVLGDQGVAPDLILITHADLDHCGGNRRMRERYPRALLACPEADRRWIESNAAMVAENYMWHAPYGLDQPDEHAREELFDELGGDAPVDLTLRGGESIRLGASRRFEVLHLPGHTRGHIGLWDPTARVAITIDAALSDGIYDRFGNKLIPPRYYDAEAYRSTIRRIRALEPDLLLTAHYEPMDPAQCREFCERSLAHVDAVEAIVRKAVESGETRLKELTDLVDERLGPFPEYATELAAGIRSHLAALA
jgi:glyoxylase-like metal-dependent hydrolase (beta-lactamase superfamily II)